MMFEGTSHYYRRFRPPVAEAAVDTISAAVPAINVLLDLGTGTGQVLQALGPRVRELMIGVDRDTDMLAQAEENLASRSWDAAWRLLPVAAEAAPRPDWPAADVVTVCRAFHWMDQPRVMENTRLQLRDGGLFVVMGDGSLWRDDLEWTAVVTAVVRKYLGPRRRAGTSTFSHHSVPYADVLAAGGFRQVRVVDHRFERVWTPEQVLGYLYSTSFSAPALYGDRRDAFESDLLTVLHESSRNGVLVEDVNFELVMGIK